MKKRVLSAILAVFMLASLLPVAYAAEAAEITVEEAGERGHHETHEEEGGAIIIAAEGPEDECEDAAQDYYGGCEDGEHTPGDLERKANWTACGGGYKEDRYKCTVCGDYCSKAGDDVSWESGDGTKHTPGNTKYAANWTACGGGYKEDYYRCTVCGDYCSKAGDDVSWKSDDGTKHTPGSTKHAADWTACGYGYTEDYYECTVCGDYCNKAGEAVYWEFGDGTKHTPGSMIERGGLDACGFGYTEDCYACTVCGNDCNASGQDVEYTWGKHTPGSTKYPAEGGCTMKMIADYYICTVCGDKCYANGEPAYLYRTGGKHTPGSTKHAASWTACGGGFKEAYYECTVCGEECNAAGNDADWKSGDGSKHTAGTSIGKVTAECGGTEQTVYKCSVCGNATLANGNNYYYSETLHTPGKTLHTKNYTESAGGYKYDYYSCTKCGAACYEGGGYGAVCYTGTNSAAIKITAQPVAASGYVDSTVSFSVTASGKSLSYQWQWRSASGTDWCNVSSMTGNKTATLSVPVTAARNGYYYRCKLTDANGATAYTDGVKLTVKTKFTSQPADVSAAVGATACFKVTATGAGLSYQWQYKSASGTSWTNVKSMTGYNTATLSVPVTAARNGYSYRCKVTDANGATVNSNTAKLTVTGSTALSITSQPASASGAVGSTVKFKVTATGTGLSYQWQYKTASGASWANVKSMTGYNTATLSVPVTAARNGYSYRCKVTDANGATVNSNAAKLTVTNGTNVSVTSQPVAAGGVVGSTVQFKVTATGTGLSYQWQYKTASGTSWTNVKSMTGYNTATLNVPVTAARNGYSYRCKVTDSAGKTAYSNGAKLTVKTKITSQPVSVDADVGTRVSFKVVATGAGLSYQWQFMRAEESSWNNCSGTGNKTAQMSFKVSEKLNGHSYRCQITDGTGKTVYSNTVKLTVKTVITGQPENANAAVGEAVSFAVTATGAGLSYQWQFKRAGESAWYNSTCTGNKTAQISFTAAERLNGHSYRCVITDANGGQTYSNTATLTVE